jgi:hypothetical protein
MRKILLLMVLLLALGATYVSGASCSAKAYASACSGCSFDANGKIDSSCSSAQRAGGIACVSTSYPIMSAKYSAGECPAVDACASELSSCVSQYSTGNDKADCQEGSLSVCYSSADYCVQSAARKCGEIEQQCPGSSTGIILAVLGIVGMAAAKKYF